MLCTFTLTERQLVIWQAYALRMGLSLDYLVERVIPQMMTEHYELVTAERLA